MSQILPKQYSAASGSDSLTCESIHRLSSGVFRLTDFIADGGGWSAIWKFSRSILLFLGVLSCVTGSVLEAGTFYVNYSKVVKIEDVLAYHESILHPTVDLDPGLLRAAGHSSLGYLSIGEIAPDAPYRDRAISSNVPRPMRNEVWKSDVVDLSSSEWREFVIEDLASQIVEKGFDGFFLDTMDAVELLISRFPDRADEFRRGLVRLVKDLRLSFPEKRIVVNRGFAVMDEIRDVIDGVMVESVFGSFDHSSGAFRSVPASDTSAILNLIRPLYEAGKDIYVLDYADPLKPSEGQALSRKASELGFHTFISTPALNGVSVAPLRKMPRKVLVLFGNDPSAGPWAPRYPSDSSTFLTLHMCFEWLGIEVEYFNAFENGFHFDPKGEYRAILTDQTLVIPSRHEQAFVDSVIKAKESGVKLLLAGHVPITGWVQTQRLFTALGIRGTGDLVPNIASQRLLKKDSDIMDFKERVRLVPFNNLDLQGPADADVSLSVECRTLDEKNLVYDAVFSASWGGIMFEPYLFFTRPNYDDLWLLDPFKFLRKALDLDEFPVPDTTTRDGMRLFYSHIDGDGFANISEVDPNRRSSEIVRDFILTRYPFPITYSVIEAEVEAISMLQKSDTAPELREIARSIFALPNIQMASHSYSHPFFWIDDDPRQAIYNSRHLPLKNNYRFSLDREIKGSIDYINQELAPNGKEVELFLWSGNCRPSVEAMKKVRDQGILNMNGGDTLISTAKPSLSFVSPRTLSWDGELQILAANQNENVYTHDWTGPYFGMYSKVIDTFEKTESPIRLKPVNVYFHNYCGDKPDGLQSLITVFDWVQRQELHSVTALQYAKIARDSRFTTIYQRTPNHFVMVNEGELRTFRLRSTDLVPDFERSSGVVGYVDHEGYRYVHTDGRRRIELVLVPGRESDHYLFLAKSSGEISWESSSRERLRFEARDVRPVHVEIGGVPAEKPLAFLLNGESQSVKSDSNGRVILTLPSQASVEISTLGEGGSDE